MSTSFRQSRPLCRLDVSPTCAANALLMNAPDLQKVTDWLIDGARSAPSPARMMAETCERLVQAGLPLWRVGGFVRTLHPDIYCRNFVLPAGAQGVLGAGDFDARRTPELRNSPHALVFG